MAKRKSLALREPSGKVQREKPLPPASEVRRLRDAALAGMRDPLWGSQIGRLHMAGKISAEQLAAGKRWAERAALYRAAIESPSPDPKAMNFNSSTGSPIDPDSDRGQREIARHRAAINSFIDVHAALATMVNGRQIVGTVRSVCEREEAPVGQEGIDHLCAGLTRIAEFYGLTGGRKSSNVR